MYVNAKYLISNVFLPFAHKRDPISSNLELIANVSEMDFPKKNKLLKRKITPNIRFSPHVSCREEYSHYITRRSVKAEHKDKTRSCSFAFPPSTHSIHPHVSPSLSFHHSSRAHDHYNYAEWDSRGVEELSKEVHVLKCKAVRLNLG